jgi:2,3-dihydro-2,3-dihydroxybenzoate dehydrogenase
MSEIQRQPVAVVTGGASGLGKKIAAALAANGLKIHIVDKANFQNVSDPEGRLVTMHFPAPKLDELDILVNCAAINKIAWLEDIDFNEWREMMNANAGGIMQMTKYYLKALSRANGTVLNIISNASHMPMRGSLAYNASKGAAHIMTLQMARELYDRHGITVFGISPNKLAGTPMSESIDQQVVQQRGWTIEKAREYQLAGLATHEETDPATLAEFIAFTLSTKQRHKFLHGCIIPYGA